MLYLIYGILYQKIAKKANQKSKLHKNLVYYNITNEKTTSYTMAAMKIISIMIIMLKLNKLSALRIFGNLNSVFRPIEQNA